MALADLLKPRNAAQVLSRMLTVLGVTRPDHPLTGYAPGDPQRTLLEVEAVGVADVELTVSALAAGGYLQTAAGEWLTALAASEFNVTRKEAVFTRGLLTFTCSAASGPYELTAGSVWASTATGLRFVTLEGGTVPQGGALSLLVQAEQPGSAYNVLDSSVTLLNTALPGVSVTNPPGWLTQAGEEQEGDAALRQRASLRWGELGGGATRTAYEYWALSSSSSVTKVRVLDEHPRGQGTVDVVLWGTGGIGADAVAQADAYIQARRPVTADVLVYSATPDALTVPLTVYAPGADQGAVLAAIQQNVTNLQQALDIGGKLYRSQLIEAAMSVAGVVDATLPADWQDVQLDGTAAATLTLTVSWRGAA